MNHTGNNNYYFVKTNVNVEELRIALVRVLISCFKREQCCSFTCL